MFKGDTSIRFMPMLKTDPKPTYQTDNQLSRHRQRRTPTSAGHIYIFRQQVQPPLSGSTIPNISSTLTLIAGHRSHNALPSLVMQRSPNPPTHLSTRNALQSLCNALPLVTEAF